MPVYDVYPYLFNTDGNGGFHGNSTRGNGGLHVSFSFEGEKMDSASGLSP